MITTERFDFEEWKTRREKGTTSYTTENGIKVRMTGTNEPFISEILLSPSFLTRQRFYYKNGMLGMRGYVFAQSIYVGVWRTYDEQGNLIKEVDEDKKIGKIKPENILNFLDKEGYINVKTGEGRFDENGRPTFSLGFEPACENTLVGEDKKAPLWYITIEPYFSNGYMQVDYVIDGNTGEVVDKKVEKIEFIE